MTALCICGISSVHADRHKWLVWAQRKSPCLTKISVELSSTISGDVGWCCWRVPTASMTELPNPKEKSNGLVVQHSHTTLSSYVQERFYFSGSDRSTAENCTCAKPEGAILSCPLRLLPSAREQRPPAVTCILRGRTWSRAHSAHRITDRCHRLADWSIQPQSALHSRRHTWKHLVRKIQKNPASSLCFCFSRVIFYLGQLVLICAPLDTKKYQHTKKGTNLVFCLAIMSTCTFLSFMAVPLL